MGFILDTLLLTVLRLPLNMKVSANANLPLLCNPSVQVTAAQQAEQPLTAKSWMWQCIISVQSYLWND